MSATSCVLPLIMLRTEAIYSRSGSIKALYAVAFAFYQIIFGHRKSFTRNIPNFDKICASRLENLKILGSDPG